MDAARTAHQASGASPSLSSRLPTKKNSFHSLRESKENLDRRPPLATSPSAISDTSSGTDTAGANGSQYGYDSRRSSSSSQQSDVRGRTSAGRPGQTRIPRPSPSQKATLPTPRRPLSLKDAYQMATEEEDAAVAAAAQGSPSPAPRPWRSRAGGGGPKGTPTPAPATTGAGVSGRATPMSASESRMQRILAQSPLDVGGRRTARRLAEPLFQSDQQQQQQRSQRRGGDDDDARSVASNSTTARSERAGDEGDRRRIRYEEDQARMQVALGEKSGGLFSPKARVSPKIAVAGRELHRRASNSSLGEKNKVAASVTTARTSLPASQSSWASNRGKPGSYLKRMVSAPDSVAPRSEESSVDLGGGVDSSGDVGAAAPPAASPLKIRSVTAPHLAVDEETEDGLVIVSPGKSFAWDADEDFTARDLMVSESPPLKTREDPGISDTPDAQQAKSPQSRPRNNKLDEIRRLEIEAELRFPDEPASEERRADPDELFPRRADADTDADANTNADANADADADASAEKSDISPQPPRRTGLPAERTNKTLDEIRARENEGLSKRAISAAKLDAIRQQNAEYRRPPPQKASLEHLRAELARDKEERDDTATHAGDRSVFDEEGERIPNTPITIYRTSSTDRGRKAQTLLNAGNGNDVDRTRNGSASASPGPSRKYSSSSSHSRTESQELLRKLAKVTTSVAAAERKDKVTTSPKKLSQKASGDSLRGSSGGVDLGAEKNLRLPRSRHVDTLRPTVGFAQLRRVSSTESASTKRSSVAQSDSDPVDRIEAEMKLFAPTENHSERGSIRAPSPDEDADADADTDTNETASGTTKGSYHTADDATPRPAKVVNPLMQPTPRVTGAYVETPVTARTEKIQEVINNAAPPQPEQPAKTTTAAAPKAEKRKSLPGILSLLRGPATTTTTSMPGPEEAAEAAGKPINDSANVDSDLASASAALAAKSDELAGRLRRLSASRQRSRSQSASGARTPLLNSARPASARDDLLAIQRDQQVDDSTLDDFDAILATHATAAPDDQISSGATIKKSLILKGVRKSAAGEDGTTDSERLRRMSQSINAFAIDVQEAKRGVERLEGQVSHPGKNGGALAQLDQGAVEEEKEERRVASKKTDGAAAQAKKVKSEELDLDIDDVALVKRKQHKHQSSSVTTATVPKKEAHGAAAAQPTPAEVTVSYVRVPLPRLYRSDPDRSRLTFLGVLALLLSVWLAAESATCALYCKPEACASGQVCRWSPDDPSFGAAVPVKLDQWLAGGRGRVLAEWAVDELGDWAADAWDAATGADIRQVDSTYFTFEEKRRHRRRLQKRGLVQPWTPPAEVRPKLEAWRRAREAREREQREREETAYSGGGNGGGNGGEYAYEYDDDSAAVGVGRGSERMAADEKVAGWW